MEEQKKEVVQDTNNSNISKYLDEINNLKANSVSKEEYDKLKAENSELLKSIVNSRTPEKEEPKTPVVDINELRANFKKEDPSNLEYVQNALKLRDAIIAQGGTDPFLPQGKKIIPTEQDIEAANRVASVLKECVDYANGDSQLFTNELYRRIL